MEEDTRTALRVEQSIFSNTDNDLVTMIEIVGFNMERFKLHLKLYGCF